MSDKYTWGLWRTERRREREEEEATEAMDREVVLRYVLRLGTLTSTGYTSDSWKEFMCPSGRRPLGKSERRTNSGSVRSSSRESVNRVPLVDMC